MKKRRCLADQLERKGLCVGGKKGRIEQESDTREGEEKSGGKNST